jgi:hypothetical protein
MRRTGAGSHEAATSAVVMLALAPSRTEQLTSNYSRMLNIYMIIVYMMTIIGKEGMHDQHRR